VSAPPVDLDTCDREPIHVPGAIQPFGALLALDAGRRLMRRSQNAEALLGPLPALGQQLPPAHFAELEPLLEAFTRDVHAELEPLELWLEDRCFDVVAQRSGPWLLLEFELRDPEAPPLSVFALKAQRGLERIQRQRTLEALLEVATEEIGNLTGFDRVMAYRFLHDDSGHVVAERKKPELETFLGLRYPASDIPAQARRLFALNRLRFIPDLSYRPVPLEPECGPGTLDPLDLSQSMLRSVSPVHVEYLQNMGVTGSMSISIVVGGDLWGLFACHHYDGPRLVPHSVRVATQLLAQVVSVLVERIEIEQRSRALDAARVLRQQLSLRAKQTDDVLAALAATPSFVELVQADGGAILWDKRVHLLGRTPPIEAVGALAEWLRANHVDVFKSHALGLELPELAAALGGTAGLLAARFQREQEGWLFWFRAEEAETVRWAGNPEKTYSEGPLGARLNPRGSFREWRETVRGRAAPWLPHEVDVASAFRLDVQEVALAKLVELERARDVMLAALGHDLRTPLSAIAMAATLLSGESSKSADLGERIARSSGRMQRLVDHMLDLSRIQSGLGLGVSREPGDLATLVRHAIDEARTGFPGTEMHVSLPEAAQAHFDADRMGQVVSNLLSNARHHGKLGRPIHVSLQSDSENAVLTVTNEGGPIPPATRAQLFQPFKVESLQHRTNRNGLGLGLHIVSEIVKSHGGRIEVEDTEEKVTFRVVIAIAVEASKGA
jgi:chemotaxis family two-component system sensor kinase Cph1